MDKETIEKMEQQEPYAPKHLHEITDYRDTWRIFRIMAELVEGYNFLAELDNEVTLLGSARLKEDNQYYQLAREIGGLLAKQGFTVMTGGGPGIMEAGNRGAFEAKGKSVGINIQLPFEQRVNPYVKSSTAFYYFFTRKVMLTSPANAFFFFPGGFGTLDEFFEVVDNMDLGMMTKSPVVLVGSDFWNPILDFLRQQCATHNTIDLDVLDSWHVVDDPQKAAKLVADVKDVPVKECELSPLNFQSDNKIDWKIFRVMAELVEGFEFVSDIGHAVTVLGTRGITVDSPYYDQAYKLGQALAESEFSVVTGGKFGVAEAANKGAFEAGGVSIGIGMNVGKSREKNAFLTKQIMFDFPFTRKLIITAPTDAFVFFPGGLGTLHHLFEVLTLMQTKKMKKVPVILVDHEFWTSMHEFIKKTLVHDVETISDEDDELYQIVDDVEGVMKIMAEI